MAESESVQALMALGFTGMEAEVYTLLLQESPATGYRVAQALGRPVAGVYKTLESLAGKGAVLVDEGTTRQCRAVPAEELLARLERSFESRREEAAQALSELRSAPADERIYQLRTPEQVWERARTMLGRCQQIALVDIFPLPLQVLKADLEATVARGPKVAVQVYQPAEVRGARVNAFPWGPRLLERAPWQLVIIDVDGTELLWAMLDLEGRSVRQAFWTGSPMLAFSLYGFVATEFVFGALLSDPDLPKEVREIMRRYAGYVPGILEVRGYHEIMGVPFPPAAAPETTGGE
jgi:sugar-specific transcriptional regulator TrmB